MEHFSVLVCSSVFLVWVFGTQEHSVCSRFMPSDLGGTQEHAEHGFLGLVCHAEDPTCFAYAVSFRVLLDHARVVVKQPL